jgi:DNA-binding protein HU-beta
VNKAELIDALAVRLGEKKTASVALDAVLAEVQAAVTKGDKVSITGFGVFEKRTRAARMARNPRTGEAVKVKKTAVPAFRAGAGFKEMVASGKAPRAAAPAKSTAAKKTTTTAAKKTTAKKASPATATAKKTAAKKTTAKKTAPAKKTTVKATTAARKTATKAVVKKTAAKKAPARKAPAKKSTR